MAYLSCPSCGLSVHRRPHDIVNLNCPRCGRLAPVVDRLSQDFAFGVRRVAAGVVVELSGELDAWTARKLDAGLEELRDTGPASIVVDLRGLAFIDSSGIATLVDWTRRARREAFAFELIDGTPVVSKILDICGVREVLAFREPVPSEAPPVNR